VPECPSDGSMAENPGAEENKVESPRKNSLDAAALQFSISTYTFISVGILSK